MKKEEDECSISVVLPTRFFPSLTPDILLFSANRNPGFKIKKNSSFLDLGSRLISLNLSDLVCLCIICTIQCLFCSFSFVTKDFLC